MPLGMVSGAQLRLEECLVSMDYIWVYCEAQQPAFYFVVGFDMSVVLLYISSLACIHMMKGYSIDQRR